MASSYSDKPILPRHHSFINVNPTERVISVALGTYLFYSGLNHIFSAPVRSLVRAVAGGYLLSRGISGNCPLYQRLDQDSTQTQAINIRCNFTVNKNRNEVYQAWRKLGNLPLFMKHLQSVEETDATHSHWTVNLPGKAGKISFNAEIVKEEEGNLIGWRSVSGSPVDHAGKVEFFDADGGGTELRVVLSYHSPIGAIGTTLGKLLNPYFEKFISGDVYNFKKFIEHSETAPLAKNVRISVN